MVNLSRITIPTPQPYSPQAPCQQLENACYVLLQILTLAKADKDDDPFGLLAAHPNVSLDIGDANLKIFGDAAIVESV